MFWFLFLLIGFIILMLWAFDDVDGVHVFVGGIVAMVIFVLWGTCNTSWNPRPYELVETYELEEIEDGVFALMTVDKKQGTAYWVKQKETIGGVEVGVIEKHKVPDTKSDDELVINYLSAGDDWAAKAEHYRQEGMRGFWSPPRWQVDKWVIYVPAESIKAGAVTE